MKLAALIKNQKGQALVVVLLGVVIAFLFVMATLYMVVRGGRVSGVQKRYQSSLDAADSGVSVSVKFLDDKVLSLTDSSILTAPINIVPASGSCLEEKLEKPTTSWSVCAGSQLTLDPTVSPDITFVIKGMTGPLSTYTTQYTVNAKIVDSRRGVSLAPPGNLQTGGVVNSEGAITPVELPYYYYTVEVAGRSQAGSEMARLTYIYAK